MALGPLTGYTVVEIGGGAAAMAGRALADMGAAVTRIEAPGGDALRHDLTYPVSTRWAWYTLNKHLEELEQAALPGRIASAAPSLDLLIDGLRPGELETLGLDIAALRRDNPHLVVLSLTDYGLTGPYRDFAGSALTNFAMGGSLSRCGRPTEPPLTPPAEIADTIGGFTAALAAVAALMARGESGQGDWIDCSVAEACMSAADWSIPVRSLSAMPNQRTGGGPAYPVYRAADGHVRIVNMVPAQWQRFIEWVGVADAFTGPEWLAVQYRVANAEAIDAICEPAMLEKARAALFEEGQAAGVAIAPVYAPEDVPGNAHFAARASIAEIETDLGGVRAPRSFMRFGREIPDAPRAVVRGPAPAPPARPDHDLSPLDFRALRVVEMGTGGPGPEAARLLGILGADVIKVESRIGPDFLRATAGPGNLEGSPAFAASNRNKRSIELDLRDAAGRETLLALIDKADVFIENFAGGVAERFGAGYDAVSARNPALVYGSSQMLGAWGPASAYSGFGPSNHAISGLAYLWTHPSNPKPEGTSLVHPDHLAGRVLAMAVIAALGERRMTGRGQFIDVSQAELAMSSVAERFIEASLAGQSVRRGHDHPSFVPHGVFPTMLPEEWLAIAVETDDQWAALRRAVGPQPWADAPGLATIDGRIAARASIAEGVAAWTRALPRQPAFLALQAAGVPAMPVMSPLDQLADVHFNTRGDFETINHPVIGAGRYDAPPFRFEHLPLAPGTRAPLLGEHSDEIRREWLGEA